MHGQLLVVWCDGAVISRFSAWLLVAAGVFNVVIWPRFAKAIVDDERAWSGEAWSSAPTSFLWVHAVLIVTAIAFGLCVLVIGARALRSHRSAQRGSRRTT
ncbi:SCO4848 family membrane protein [Aeromicrobium sp. CF4.19]|uniref:SCO4848 family membrane protein n=1 Tax=Aeromicrobium sp. CF4.19 TaxID=3373082 RepID=UPI003EE51CAF